MVSEMNLANGVQDRWLTKTRYSRVETLILEDTTEMGKVKRYLDFIKQPVDNDVSMWERDLLGQVGSGWKVVM